MTGLSDILGSNPIESLSGTVLDGRWKIESLLKKNEFQTGSCFSVGYAVRSTKDGTSAFAKILDFSRALQEVDTAAALHRMTEEYIFERELLKLCATHDLTRVISALDFGEIKCSDVPLGKLFVIIFEMAEADVRKYLSTTGLSSLAWRLRVLHDISIGLSQLHGKDIHHQDLKPSNVLLFDGGGRSKVGDLGRAHCQTLSSPNDSSRRPGAFHYAPPEQLYDAGYSDRLTLRRAGDLYLLGSMLDFFVTGVPTTVRLVRALGEIHRPFPSELNGWRGLYGDVLPHLQTAHAGLAREFRSSVMAMIEVSALSRRIANELTDLFRYATNPDPTARGHPSAQRMLHVSNFDLQRFISAFEFYRNAPRSRKRKPLQSAPADLNRQLVPRWRSLPRTPTAELESHIPSGPPDEWVTSELDRRLTAWSTRRDFESAQELVWAASIFRGDGVAWAGLRQVVDSPHLPSHVREDASSLLEHAPTASIELTLDATSTKEILISRIRSIRKELRVVPTDPIAYTNLAMLYSRLGQIEPAERAIKVAVQLSPSSRYVLRAATRFMVHIGKFDRALWILEKALSTDPWLHAARVALYDLTDSPIRRLADSKKLLQQKLAARHLSELASAFATLELKAGHVGRAKKLFRASAVDPTDNVIAQLQWASIHKAGEFADELLTHLLTYEARTAVAKQRRDWTSALNNCAKWLDDEPFSIRPAQEGSFIAAEYTHDFEKALEFCEIGLIANPDSFSLLNNASYAQAALGNIPEAHQLLQSAQANVQSAKDRIVSVATSGFISFRIGRVDNGIGQYLKAIDAAIRLNDLTLAKLVVVHYFGEYIRAGYLIDETQLPAIRSLFEGEAVPFIVRDVYAAHLSPLLSAREGGPGPDGNFESTLRGLTPS